MVLLTVTPAARTAVIRYNDLRGAEGNGDSALWQPGEPSLAEVDVGSPISHGQLIHIARYLHEQDGLSHSDGSLAKSESVRLDSLLKGSKIYTPPPKPKPQPSPEYVALMARLREEEEERAYERMINPPLPVETFAQRFPSAAPAVPTKDIEDEVVYADINRQLALIVNVLVSIIACSVAIWIAARHWSVPQRLALSMTGSSLVATAEIVIFMGYIRRIKEAKQAEGTKPERKEIVETWVIDQKKKNNKDIEITESNVRNRKALKGKYR